MHVATTPVNTSVSKKDFGELRTLDLRAVKPLSNCARTKAKANLNERFTRYESENFIFKPGKIKDVGHSTNVHRALQKPTS